MPTVHQKKQYRNSSTALATSSKPTPPSQNLMGGSTRIEDDTIVLSLYADTTLSKIFPQLKRSKERLQETDHSMQEIVSFGLGDTRIQWAVQRTGVNMYPYVLKSGDITLLLSPRPSDSPMPSASLHIGSMSSQIGTKKIYELVQTWCAMVGIRIVRNIVSRADMCVDVQGFDLNDPLLRICDPKFYVRKTLDFATYGTCDRFDGVSIGGKKTDKKLRIYDKVRELNKRENEAKKEFFTQKWGCFPELVIRVEYQLRRGALKEFLEVGDLDDYLNNKHQLWNYLTYDWFRHTLRPVDRKNRNQDKMPLSIFWQKVVSASSHPDKAVRKKISHKLKPITMLKAQVRGLLTTICAGVGHEAKDFFGILATVSEIAQEEMKIAMSKTGEWKKIFDTRQTNTILVYDEKPEIDDNPYFSEDFLWNNYEALQLKNARQLEMAF